MESRVDVVDIMDSAPNACKTCFVDSLKMKSTPDFTLLTMSLTFPQSLLGERQYSDLKATCRGLGSYVHKSIVCTQSILFKNAYD
ncbi:hypothetical protein Vi05172_g6284 [Venturia inaequalis]|nr:hypothetical protein Vi05172_g6284 [Venturia inaequalis]